jgi:hypothetical protein
VPRPWRWLIGTGRSLRYGAPFLTRFDPTDAAQRGELTSGVFEWRGNQSRACDGGRLAPTIGVVDDELQRSANDKISLHGGGTTRKRVTWCWLDVARSPTERRRAMAAARVSVFVDQNLS